jgi:hypothetical protein
MSRRVMGKALIKAAGRTLDTLPGSSLDVGGVTRETVNGDNRVIGYTSKPRPSKLECEIAVVPGLSAAEIGRWEDVTVTFQADTGQTWVIPGGWVTEPPMLTAADGKMKITIEGPPAEEML